jgi:hypothetical protein
VYNIYQYIRYQISERSTAEGRGAGLGLGLGSERGLERGGVAYLVPVDGTFSKMGLANELNRKRIPATTVERPKYRSIEYKYRV